MTTFSGSVVTTSVEAYACASNVAQLCGNLLGDAVNFSLSTSPTLDAVNVWLSSGCSIIETQLTAQGYTVPITTGTLARSWLQNLNTLYAAAYAEMSRINVTLTPGERTRGQVFMEMFDTELKRLSKIDLTNAGATKSVSSNRGTLFVGGISAANKSTYETNTDRVTPRFKRELFAVGATDEEDNA